MEVGCKEEKKILNISSDELDAPGTPALTQPKKWSLKTTTRNSI